MAAERLRAWSAGMQAALAASQRELNMVRAELQEAVQRQHLTLPLSTGELMCVIPAPFECLDIHPQAACNAGLMHDVVMGPMAQNMGYLCTHYPCLAVLLILLKHSNDCSQAHSNALQCTPLQCSHWGKLPQALTMHAEPSSQPALRHSRSHLPLTTAACLGRWRGSRE